MQLFLGSVLPMCPTNVVDLPAAVRAALPSRRTTYGQQRRLQTR